MTPIREELLEHLGEQGVLLGTAARDRMPPGSSAELLVLPRTTQEVSEVLAICHKRNAPVVPQGGLTGLVLGTRSEISDVVVSLERMRRIVEVDIVNRCVTAEAGVPLEMLQQEAEESGFMVPLDLGSRGSATVGGNIATNAGGTRVVRFGMAREMVLGLEVVLADGTILDARSKLIKNNAGYDLKHLFIGSEGTLGIVTCAVLRLWPLPRSFGTALVGLASFDAVVGLLNLLQNTLLGRLTSFEVLWPAFYDLVTSPPARGRRVLNRGHSYYVLLETMHTGEEGTDEALLTALVKGEESGLVQEACVAQSRAQRLELWALREDVKQMRRNGATVSYDVSLPLDAMEGYVSMVRRELETHFGAHDCYVFGHAADGNLHLVVRAPTARTEQEIHEVVYGSLPPLDNSVSAEHGIGLKRKPYLHVSRSEAELTVMRTLKAALDPKGILNRGKIFD